MVTVAPVAASPRVTCSPGAEADRGAEDRDAPSSRPPPSAEHPPEDEPQQLVLWEKRDGSICKSTHGAVRYVTERH